MRVIYLISNLIFFLVISLSFLGCQTNYLKLIEKEKYAKAERKLNKFLAKKPDDIRLNYNKSVLLMNRKYKGYNTEKAYIYLIKSKNIFNKLTDEKEIKSLNKEPINTRIFELYTDSLCRFALDDASLENTLKAYQHFIDYYIEAPRWLINKGIEKRDISAFEIAEKENTITSYQFFIDKYPKANQIPMAIEKRNELAFQQARAIDNIESYKLFIKNYEGAVQIPLAWERIYELAFEQTSKENTIIAFEKFISEYPKAKQVKIATERIHEIAYNDALILNTSAAFKSFCMKYPKSQQFKLASEKFEERQFFENVRETDWESYKEYYLTFASQKWRNIALDSIVNIGLKFSVPAAIEYVFEASNLYENDSLLLKYYETLTSDGELASYEKFYDAYPTFFEEVEKIKDFETATLGDNLYLHLPLRRDEVSKIENYIKLAAPNEKAFVALQRLVAEDIKQKRWNKAVQSIKAYQPYFRGENKHLNDLIELLERNADASVIINAVGEPVNSKTGKEYMPLITADNTKLIFCGRQRFDNLGGEDIFITEKNGTGWKEPALIGDLSQADFNDGALSVSADGNELYLFNEGDIYISQKNLNGWDAASPLNTEVNTTKWEGDVSIGSDGNSMLFVRADQKNSANFEIVFLLDASGSMQPCIDGVKENILNFISELESDDTKETKWKAKAIYYKDVMEDYDSYVDAPFYSDVEELENYLGAILAGGGGDEPESTMESIFRTAIETEWSRDESVTRVIVCFTDATNKNATSAAIQRKFGQIDAIKTGKQLNLNSIYLYLFGQTDEDYNTLSAFKDVQVTQYDNAVEMLQEADYSEIMSNLSDQISLLANNQPVYHGDKLINGDIFVSHKNENGNWSKPQSIGSVINTRYSERTPFLHPDMKTLYFSSDGHGGLGKLDVYKSTRLSDTCWTCWSMPVNLGKEINTAESDWGYKISTDGERAYFAKKRSSSEDEDLFYVKLPPHLRPDYVATISGKLLKKDNTPIVANIRWEDLETGKNVGQSKSSPDDGSYFVVLPLGKIYGYYIDKNDYFPISNNIDLRAQNKPVELTSEISMITFKEMIDDGIAVPINNLFFEFGKYTLLSYSIPELRRLAKIIVENNLNVEIDGHTDNVGDDASNQKLSELRASSVKEFLVSNGCNPDFILTRGYGESKPVSSNETDVGRATNRRVELKFTH